MANPLYDAFFGRHSGQSTPFLLGGDGTVTTHEAFLQRAARFAQVLVDAGVAPGDRVAAQVGKTADALALYAACVRAGAVFLPLNTAYTVVELDYFVSDSGARVLVCDPESAEALAPVAEKAGAVVLTLDANGGGSLSERAEKMDGDFVTVARGTDDLAALLYTSGTTGRSKGAMLTHDNLVSNGQALAELWRFTADDTLIHALPIFHTHGLFVAISVTLVAGGSMIFLPGFTQDAVIEAMPRATAMMGVPTFYTRLLADERLTANLTLHMRLFVSGSAPLLAETHHEFETRTGHLILERYGMTETNMNASNPYEGERRPGTVGFPLSGTEIVIRDPTTGADLPKGEVGAIEVRGPNVFKGYWNMPEKTAEELRADGFFITGDLGMVDADGYLHIVGRGKDLIISGGYNIYPKEVELVLDELPGVLESAVVGAPHADFGEGVVGVLVRAPGGEIDEEAIAAAMRESLARYKQPKRLMVIDALPRNTMGKVQKNVLRDLVADSFTAAVK